MVFGMGVAVGVVTATDCRVCNVPGTLEVPGTLNAVPGTLEEGAAVQPSSSQAEKASATKGNRRLRVLIAPDRSDEIAGFVQAGKPFFESVERGLGAIG